MHNPHSTVRATCDFCQPVYCFLCVAMILHSCALCCALSALLSVMCDVTVGDTQPAGTLPRDTRPKYWYQPGWVGGNTSSLYSVYRTTIQDQSGKRNCDNSVTPHVLCADQFTVVLTVSRLRSFSVKYLLYLNHWKRQFCHATARTVMMPTSSFLLYFFSYYGQKKIFTFWRRQTDLFLFFIFLKILINEITQK